MFATASAFEAVAEPAPEKTGKLSWKEKQEKSRSKKAAAKEGKAAAAAAAAPAPAPAPAPALAPAPAPLVVTVPEPEPEPQVDAAAEEQAVRQKQAEEAARLALEQAAAVMEEKKRKKAAEEETAAAAVAADTAAVAKPVSVSVPVPVPEPEPEPEPEPAAKSATPPGSPKAGDSEASKIGRKLPGAAVAVSTIHRPAVTPLMILQEQEQASEGTVGEGGAAIVGATAAGFSSGGGEAGALAAALAQAYPESLLDLQPLLSAPDLAQSVGEALRARNADTAVGGGSMAGEDTGVSQAALQIMAAEALATARRLVAVEVGQLKDLLMDREELTARLRARYATEAQSWEERLAGAEHTNAELRAEAEATLRAAQSSASDAVEQADRKIAWRAAELEQLKADIDQEESERTSQWRATMEKEREAVIERLEQEYAQKLAAAMEDAERGFEAAKHAGEVRREEAEAAHELAEERAKGVGARLNAMQEEHSALRGELLAAKMAQGDLEERLREQEQPHSAPG